MKISPSSPSSFRLLQFATRLDHNSCWMISSSSSSLSLSLFSTSSSASSSTSTFRSALVTLNLNKKPDFSRKDLRNAYFTAAKLCHPDSQQKKKNCNDDDDDNYFVQRFLRLTEAYELLQKSKQISTFNQDDDEMYKHCFITKSEEQYFREACSQYLGVDAETVEESKKCVVFRDWLKGRTVSAFHWNFFLMSHGGLAPMLRQKKTLSLTNGDDSNNNNVYWKRRRRRNGR